MSEWKTIESAPRDGTNILLCGESAPGGWIPHEGLRMWICHWNGKEWLESSGEGYYDFNNATHWMPLPEPPK